MLQKKQTGKSIVSPKNANELGLKDDDKNIEE